MKYTLTKNPIAKLEVSAILSTSTWHYPRFISSWVKAIITKYIHEKKKKGNAEMKTYPFNLYRCLLFMLSAQDDGAGSSNFQETGATNV